MNFRLDPAQAAIATQIETPAGSIRLSSLNHAHG